MDRKRLIKVERERIFRKIRRLEKKILILPDSDSEIESVAETAREDKENKLPDVDDAVLEFAEDPAPAPASESAVTPEPAATTPDEETSETVKLDDNILQALGVQTIAEIQPIPLRKEIAAVWTAVIKKGLKKEDKESIEKDNSVFNNIPGIPKLNPEAASTMTDLAKRRDSIIESRQKQLSSVLACLGSALHLCLADAATNKVDIIRKINEASKLVCDSIYLDTRGRRSLILSAINRDMKEALVHTEPENFLFGENLFEKISAAKKVKTSGDALKIPSKPPPAPRQEAMKKNVAGQALNWRGPPRSAEMRSQRGRQGGPKQQARPQDKKRTLADDRNFRHYRR